MYACMYIYIYMHMYMHMHIHIYEGSSYLRSMLAALMFWKLPFGGLSCFSALHDAMLEEQYVFTSLFATHFSSSAFRSADSKAGLRNTVWVLHLATGRNKTLSQTTLRRPDTETPHNDPIPNLCQTWLCPLTSP